MAHDRVRHEGRARALRRATQVTGGSAVGDAVQVYRWLRGCALPGEVAERVAVEVAHRAAGSVPACVAAADPSLRLQFLTAQAVLRSRGVL